MQEYNAEIGKLAALVVLWNARYGGSFRTILEAIVEKPATRLVRALSRTRRPGLPML